ncbi:ATP-dependent DNA helicase DDX11 isoform X2 [Cephus cinctus]|uniref:ATP-dependent DNA helicase DDX11 isoform X2 n=1 Tax=Cephus cinctus TaxID=211228 RepID=A0AAJ7BTJ5_CEPCN|nr:ATP-dependent DNA helicase DDX11 isoform X2 [Cephus cinctus]
METPEEFIFPFPPYAIQEDFMKNLYFCLENGKLGIFESPTGTGKSLSIICGALKWLLDHEERQKSDLIEKIQEIDSSIKESEKKADHDWFFVQSSQLEFAAERRILQQKLNMIIKHNEKREKLKERVQNNKENKKRYYKPKPGKSKDSLKDIDQDSKEGEAKNDTIDEDFLLDDFLEHSDSSEDEDTQEDIYKNSKIYFCSRTHSQLKQFVSELKKTPYSDKIALVPLASRQNYCINKEVKKLKHVNFINERCLQLQKKCTTAKKEKDLKRLKSSTCCPYMPGDQQRLIADILSEVQDVEDIVQNSQELKTCPYYATRNSIPDSQIILVPYNTILHKSTRISSGIDLKGNILIIDEAHNLLEAIEHIHSAMITGRNVLHCYSQLTQYQQRYQHLFSAKNVLYLSQLCFCLKKLLKFFGATVKSSPDDASDPSKQSTKFYTVEDFETASELDTINIFELLDFVKNSKLNRKLQGYLEKYGGETQIQEVELRKTGITAFLKTIKAHNLARYEMEAEQKELLFDKEVSSNPLMTIVSFLECLKSSCEDGRILLVPGKTIGQGVMKFLLLNPAAYFNDIARAVIVAGGTMEPISDFKDRLFIKAGASPERIMSFSCDHVVPKDNIMTRIVTHGPNAKQFIFTYGERASHCLLEELSRSLINICNVVPAGIVVFLQSYTYEEVVYKYLVDQKYLNKISDKKRVFREPKYANQVSQVLEEYAEAVKNPQPPQNGALLFSVVGGKLSEGLNFSDDLGRCVIVVGMPYPNLFAPEIREKMNYLNENVGYNTGTMYYENACMKAVNQCIGRAVRHINDYAGVILLDQRYTTKKTSLPRWIQRSLSVDNSFGMTIRNLAKFYSTKKHAERISSQS